MWILFSLDLPEHVRQEIKETCSYLFADDYTAEKTFPQATTQEDRLKGVTKFQNKSTPVGNAEQGNL